MHDVILHVMHRCVYRILEDILHVCGVYNGNGRLVVL